ncbi:MAG: helix-turn-helix domain-containing protein [Clostridiales bacterium]|nr:helix-turn-helix domain-containing protein [Clostridiales bacterium]
MDQYVTGNTICKLREEKGLTQEQLAEKLFVSSKTISKWENGHGFPDISLIEPLAAALGISVIELFSGEEIRNTNKSANILRSRFYVCPLCGNVLFSSGEAVVSCCGITLPALEAEDCDGEHRISAEVVEDEYYVTMHHPATKTHYLSFFAAVSDMGVQFQKLYPESTPEARFKINRIKWLYAYCNHHGLFRLKL